MAKEQFNKIKKISRTTRYDKNENNFTNYSAVIDDSGECTRI
jgi:hypothetical protein